MEYKKKITTQQAFIKAAGYCAYQERCYKEVEGKLAEWGISGTEAGELMIRLSEQNYLNEERFAKAFAGGKFRVKKWGRTKIRQELKQRNISDYCIRSGMKEIDEQDYLITLETLASGQLARLTDKQSFTRRNKVIQWLIGKGYEMDLILETLTKLM